MSHNNYPSPEQLLEAENKRQQNGRKTKKIVGKVLLCLGTVLLSVVILFFGAVSIINYGPSGSARDLFVVSMLETSAAKFLATWYFSPEEIAQILARNTVEVSDEVTDGNLVDLPKEDDVTFDKQKIEVVEVKGGSYKGKMMIINDPSRVYVATPPAFGEEVDGMRVEEMARRDGAIGGVNAGGFKDENGIGRGGEPLGIVISDGKLLAGNHDTVTEIIGFDSNHKLVVGRMTGKQALDRGIRDAVSFGPTLIVNGQAADVKGTGGGVNPRTAIGQRADGTVLLLVIDGRQAHSIGATYKDLVDVMVQFGAVNAANLDGGSSSLMVYNDEIITTCASLYGSRRLPTAILIK